MTDQTPKERPILFSEPMVRAILTCKKSQTRRLVGGVTSYEGVVTGTVAQERGYLGMHCFISGDESVYLRCRYGNPGDRLWVRERHCFLDVAKSALSQFPLGPQNGNERGPDVWNLDIEYSDGTENGVSVEGEKPKQTRQRGETRWRPGIHMPRWASRITLEVTGVRVERLQAISEADAVAEGVDAVTMADVPRQATWSRCDDYRQLWDSLNKAPGYGWDVNPLVWVIEFKKVTA
jgi:hypothetical protein